MTFIETGNSPVRLLAAFFDHFPSQTPEYLTQAPNREMWGMAALSNSGCFTFVVPDMGDEVRVTIKSARAGLTVLNRPLPEWALFPVGVLVLLVDAGFALPGGDIALAGEEPAGPRYAYALGITTAALLYQLSHQPYTADALTELVERVRRDFSA